ncbi:MAG: hypothetical protein ACLQNE_29990 [Thermoguttaceae bacterium]
MNMKRLAICLAMICLALPGCSSREVFESEKTAKSLVAGKNFQKVMENLGPPDAVREGGSLPDGTVFSEIWQYRRTVRENRTGDLTDLNLFLYRGMVVGVSSGKVKATLYNPGASLSGGLRGGSVTPPQDGKMRVAP